MQYNGYDNNNIIIINNNVDASPILCIYWNTNLV